MPRAPPARGGVSSITAILFLLHRDRTSAEHRDENLIPIEQSVKQIFFPFQRTNHDLPRFHRLFTQLRGGRLTAGGAEDSTSSHAAAEEKTEKRLGTQQSFPLSCKGDDAPPEDEGDDHAPLNAQSIEEALEWSGGNHAGGGFSYLRQLRMWAQKDAGEKIAQELFEFSTARRFLWRRRAALAEVCSSASTTTTTRGGGQRRHREGRAPPPYGGGATTANGQSSTTSKREDRSDAEQRTVEIKLPLLSAIVCDYFLSITRLEKWIAHAAASYLDLLEGLNWKYSYEKRDWVYRNSVEQFGDRATGKSPGLITRVVQEVAKLNSGPRLDEVLLLVFWRFG